MRLPAALHPAIGGLGLGIIGAVYLYTTEQNVIPPFFANGYPAIKATLGQGVIQFSVLALLLMFLLKLVATCLTLGSGGSGGIFAPSLMLGASLGGAFGVALSQLGLISQQAVPTYALVGMAAMVAGSIHAPLTAIVMMYEMTRDPNSILPVMFAAVVATSGARLLLRDSIYTLKLRRRGVRVGSVADLTILRRIAVSDIPAKPAPAVHPEDPLQMVIDLAGEIDTVDFVVVGDQEEYLGMVIGKDVRTALLQPEAVSLLAPSSPNWCGRACPRSDPTRRLTPCWTSSLPAKWNPCPSASPTNRAASPV